MVCKNCGATLIDEAVFCNNCGTRVDGKKPCKKCGRLNDENNTFCIFCGERIDGKQTCSFCGATVEGKFCPHCGNKVGTTPTKQSALKNQPQQKEKPSFFNKLFGHIGQGSLILGVLLALIFVCFIGIRVSYVEEGTIVARGKESLFYFFGKYYKAVRAIKNSLNTTTRLEIINITQLVVYGVTGTIIGAATLLCTFGFGIVAIVRYILWVTGKSEKKGEHWAYACVLSFVCGAAAFLLHTRIAGVSLSSEESKFDYKMEMFTKFNGATNAGLILCGIFLTLGFVALIVAKGKVLWRGKSMTKMFFPIGGIVLSVILLVVAVHLAFSVKVSESDYIMSLRMGAMNFNKIWNELLAELYEDSFLHYELATNSLLKMNIYNIFAELCALALVVVSILSIHAHIKGVGKNKKSTIVWSSLAIVLSVFILIFTVLAMKQFKAIFWLMDDIETGTRFSWSLGTPIVVLVMSVLSLAATIVGCVLGRTPKTEEAYEGYCVAEEI